MLKETWNLQKHVVKTLMTRLLNLCRISAPGDRRGWLRIFLVLCAIGFAAFLIGSFVAVEVTSQPSFCRSCHIMEPYFKSWQTSSHHDVSCIDCHFEPGLRSVWRAKVQGLVQVVKYFTGTAGTRPWAEVEDASCLRPGCHETRLLDTGLVFKQNIRFSHAPHLADLKRGKKLKCTSCHSQVVMGEHLTVTTSTCVLCHFKGRPYGDPIAGCKGCHIVPKDTITLPGGRVYIHNEVVDRGVSCVACHASMTAGDGFVPKSRCFVCHNFDVHEFIKNPEFLHEKHVAEHKVECTNCHEEMTHGYESERRTAKLDCQGCHVGMHEAVVEMAEGGAASILGESEPRVGPMLAARVECIACHIDKHDNVRGDTFAGYTRFGENKACIDCHGSMAKNLLPQWQQQFNTRVADLERRINASRAPRDHVNEARAILMTVKHGKAVHNPTLARDLLAAAERALRGENVRPEIASAPAMSLGGLDCRYCHLAAPRQQIRFKGLSFSHIPHTDRAGIACDKCHENAPTTFPTARHGGVKITANDCQTCHHWQKGNCSSCHGNGPGETIQWRGLSFKHAPHIKAGQTCQTCHRRVALGDRLKTTMSPRQCMDCHHGNGGTADCSKCHAIDRLKETVTSGGRSINHRLHARKNDSCRRCHTTVNGAMKASAPCKECHHAANAKPDCGSCHGDGPTAAVTSTFGVFYHAKHVPLGLECKECHSAGTPKNVSFICNNCHHDEGMTPACASCHGDGPTEDVATPWKPFPHSKHIPLGIECKDCHTVGAPQTINWICTTCHEDATGV